MTTTTHHLTESDCDHLRSAMLAAAVPASPDFHGIMTAIKIFDKHRSDSFLRRAAKKHSATNALPAPGSHPARNKSLGIRYTR